MNIINSMNSINNQMIVSFVGADLHVCPSLNSNDESFKNNKFMKKSLCNREIEIKSKNLSKKSDIFEKTSEKYCYLSHFYGKNKYFFVKQEKKHINIVVFFTKRRRNAIKLVGKMIKQVVFSQNSSGMQ